MNLTDFLAKLLIGISHHTGSWRSCLNGGFSSVHQTEQNQISTTFVLNALAASVIPFGFVVT